MMITQPPAKITDDLMMLGTTEYPLFLFTSGTEAVIFEGGVGHVGPLLAPQLEQLGVDPTTVTQIVIPHAHPDHTMALPLMLKLFPNAKLATSETGQETLSAEKAIDLFCRLDDAISESLTAAGKISADQRRTELAQMQIPVDRVINDGDKVEVDGVAFDAIKTPGHSDCSFAFYQPERGILIASDSVPYFMPDQASWWPCYFGNYGQYVESMRSLRDLDAEVACLGHRAAVVGKDAVREYFDQNIEATENYHKRILEETAAGREPREIAEMLGREIFEKTGLLPLDFFQKNCMLLVKQSLKHERGEE